MVKVRLRPYRTTTDWSEWVRNPDLVIEHPVSRCAVVDVQQLSESNQ